MNTEILMQRVVDRCATIEDWDDLETQRALDSNITEQLLDRLREDDRLREAFAPVAERAERIALPVVVETASTSRWHFLSGFAAALVVGFVCWVLLLRPTNETPPALTLSDATPQVLLATYLEKGRKNGTFIEELPRIPIQVQPSDGDESQLQVFYVRRFVERGNVETAVRLASDEHGAPTAVSTINPLNAFPRDI